MVLINMSKKNTISFIGDENYEQYSMRRGVYVMPFIACITFLMCVLNDLTIRRIRSNRGTLNESIVFDNVAINSMGVGCLMLVASMICSDGQEQEQTLLYGLSIGLACYNIVNPFAAGVIRGLRGMPVSEALHTTGSNEPYPIMHDPQVEENIGNVANR